MIKYFFGKSEKIDAGSTESANLTSNVAAATEEMSTNMTSVAAATEEAAANVNVMTTATEEISSTVGEIQQSTINAKKITGEAVNQASDISSKVDELGESASVLEAADGGSVCVHGDFIFNHHDLLDIRRIPVRRQLRCR